jgi:alkylation response protein AidB-like acyl-CoA dehydrogenase
MSVHEPSGRLDLIDRARDAVPVIAAAADEIEARSELPGHVVDALHERALFRALLPRDFGGDEIEPMTYVQMVEAIATADASTAWCIGQNSGCSMMAAYVRPEVAQQIWGSDPRAVLAWGAGPTGTAKIVDGGYLVTGRWEFASGGRHATWLGAHCRLAERDGTPRRTADGEVADRTVLFPKAAASMPPNWNTMGLRGTGSDAYSVENLFVAEDFSARRDTDEDRRHPGMLYKFSTTHMYASGFAGVALGVARGALDAFKHLAMQKTPWQTNRMLRDSPVAQAQVGLAEAKLGAARRFLLGTLQDCWDSVRQTGALTLDQRVAIRMASTFATHQAKEVVDMAYHEAGATAVFATNPFERRFRDVNTITQQVQARSAHFESVGAHMLGLRPSLRFI